MVLLQLDDASPLSPEQIAVLGTADESELNQFLSYGYSQVGNYQAVRADGEILGSVEPPTDKNLQVDPIQLKSRQIAGGMSGAAVLDVNRNLVVGLVAERYFPEGQVQDDISFSADAKILTFPPFDFTLRGEDLELKPAPTVKLEEALIREALEFARNAIADRSEADKHVWHAAPAVLDEFTGRAAFLEQISGDWNDSKKHVTGLIGFGGEGKSSLARKWVDNLLNDSEQIQPDGIFWWGFYENRSVDEFFEAALEYMSGGKIEPQKMPSASMRAQVIASMLGSGRYLFVLDGLEVMQHQEGDQYGLIQSNDLRDFLTYFAAPEHESFCLVTSRAPLLDLMEYTTYSHRDMPRLILEDGIDLLRLLGVKGDDSELGKIITDWDGHALTVSLLGSYLADHFDGDIAHLDNIPLPTEGESRYERVHRVLRRYDEHLTDPEREFLKLFSAFRTPVHKDAFEKVFEPLLKASVSQITDIVSRLVSYRLLRQDAASQTYTVHPLIRNHYLALLSQREAQEKGAHEQIKDYYLSIAGDTPQYPTLDDLRPLIEVVHHTCQAGAYDEAWNIYYDRISQGNKFVILHHLGAYETAIDILLEFFIEKDLSNEPSVSDEHGKSVILGWIGMVHQNISHFSDAITINKQSARLLESQQDWLNSSIVYRNLAELYASLGALKESAAAARQALDLARRVEHKDKEKRSIILEAWAYHLLGDMKLASKKFSEAEDIEKNIDPSAQYLTRNSGVSHAIHLQRLGETNYSRRVTEFNLQYCKRNHWSFIVSMCHRVLGDFDADSGNHESAREHYDEAFKIAHGISHRQVLIEALLARGRWRAKYHEDLTGLENLSGLDQAFNDLNEALGYAVNGEYRIYEADIRVA
jgi:tetratricopeptide (TPR) repeat protein